MSLARRATGAIERRGTRPDGAPDRRFFLKVMAGTYALFLCTYVPINHFSVGRSARRLWLPGEENIPFVPEFEFVYVSAYLLPLVAVLKVPDARRLARLSAAYLLTLAVAYATYLLFPVYLERPELTVDSLATFLLSLEYLDPSYNHFPSLHVATSVLLYLGCRAGLRHPSLFLALVVAVAISTLFIKQHYLADVLYGVVLALAAWRVAGLATEPGEEMSPAALRPERMPAGRHEAARVAPHTGGRRR